MAGVDLGQKQTPEGSSGAVIAAGEVEVDALHLVQPAPHLNLYSSKEHQKPCTCPETPA